MTASESPPSAESIQRPSLWGRFVGFWREYVVGTIHRAEEESHKAQAEHGQRLDKKVVWVCIIVAVDLSLLYYFGMSDKVGWISDGLRTLGLDAWADAAFNVTASGPYARLFSLFYWVAACVFVYLVIPCLVIKLVFKEKISDYGLKLKGALKHVKLYIILYLIVLGPVIAVSFSQRFQEQYPFYKSYTNEIPPGFIYWELAYAMQFFALEFFFRGFMLHALKRRFGFYAVLAMVVPYCMIHFGKPFPETLGAILAGIALGLLSLRTGSIWLGFMIHVSVALSMDVAALWQRGLL